MGVGRSVPQKAHPKENTRYKNDWHGPFHSKISEGGEENSPEGSLWLSVPSFLSWKSLASPLLGVIFGVCATLFAIFAPVLTSYPSSNQGEVQLSNAATLEKSVELFADILTDLQYNYVDKINSEKVHYLRYSYC